MQQKLSGIGTVISVRNLHQRSSQKCMHHHNTPMEQTKNKTKHYFLCFMYRGYVYWQKTLTPKSCFEKRSLIRNLTIPTHSIIKNDKGPKENYFFKTFCVIKKNRIKTLDFTHDIFYRNLKLI